MATSEGGLRRLGDRAGGKRQDSRARRRGVHREGGQSVAELTLVLPVILLLVLATLDMGRLFMGWVTLNQAARVGANYAALHHEAWEPDGSAARRATYTTLVSDARDDAEVSLDGCSARPVPSPAFPSGTGIGAYAEVTLVCGFSPITPLIADVLRTAGTPLRVSAQAVFPIRSGEIVGPALTPMPSCLSSFSWSVDGADPLLVHFTDLTPPTASGWIWDMGDGRASANQHPSWTYAEPGTYTVTLSSSSGPVGCVPFVDEVTVSAAGPTPDPSASPAPSASPTPQPGCPVPSFIGTKKNDSAATWSGAGFTTPITYDPDPNGNWTIEFQSLVGGQEAPCNTPITLGPDPVSGT